MRNLVKIVVPAAGAVVVLAACAPPEQGDATSAGTSDQQLYETVATVLEGPDGGPFLCHVVAESLPPQCSGPEIVGWEWEAVDAESAGDTTWGEYFLVGSWDGERFHLAEPAEAAGKEHKQRFFAQDRPDFDTPCPEPEGGWEPVDPATATDDAMHQAQELAQSAPGYAGSWLDQSYLEEVEASPGTVEYEQVANDPARLVLNFRFTEDLEQREQDIREVWGGALCVTGAEHTEQELRDIQRQLHEDRSDLAGSGVDVLANAVAAEVLVATPQLQAELDSQYGEGTVILESLLQPR